MLAQAHVIDVHHPYHVIAGRLIRALQETPPGTLRTVTFVCMDLRIYDRGPNRHRILIFTQGFCVAA